MRTIFTKICTFVLFSTLAITGTVSAQNSSGTTTYSNANYSLRRWDFGFNIGATWEQSDLDKNYARIGWGFTFGKYWLRNTNKVFDIGLRFRYLQGNARGMDYTANYGLKYNTTLNGSDPNSDPNLNYDSIPGYVYNNYKMASEELSLELMLGANRLRQKTGILFYVFGGGGFFWNQTKINQLNGFNKYDYTTIDPSGGNTAVLNSLNSMMDDSYETVSEGKKNDGWVICPTLGIGIGKMLSKSTAIGLEHKITFPLHDYLDGQQWNRDVSGTATGNNDWQHYTGFYLRWYFRAHSEHTRDVYTDNGHTDPNHYTDPHDPIVTNPPPPPPPPSPARPIITISYPNSNPFGTSQNNITVTGYVQNVNNRSQITVKVNGFMVNNFSFDPTSHAISVSTLLNQGSNNVDFYAVNNAGSDQKTQFINYNETNHSGPPPTVTITNPGSNPYTSSSNMVNVVATVTNVVSSSNIMVYYNGNHVTNFTYDVNSKVLTYAAILNNGSNSLSITASNNFGSDSKTLTMMYNQVNNSQQKPVVTITYPGTNPFTVTGNSSQVTATVLNVDSKNGITINANGNPVTVFNYNMNTKVCDFTVNMNSQPSITVVITAVNNAGSDTKSTVLLQTPKANPPVVTITNPGTNPYSTTVPTLTLLASVLNVNSQNEISVLVNNSATSNFSYNMGTHVLQLTTNLNQGNNQITVSASNANGSDSKTETVIYSVPAQPPVVNIINPTGNPAYASGAVQPITATVTNITAASQCNVTINGSPVSNLTYNNGQLTFNVNLNLGSNALSVTATNNAGTDNETKTLIYQPKNVTPRPVVTFTNPSVNPYSANATPYGVTATVINVSSQSEISVQVNNQSVSGFTYNVQTTVLNLTANLNPGNNQVTITATNGGGTDSKTTTIVYSPMQPPVVTFTNPAVNPLDYSNSNPSYTLTATVTNVTAQSQIQVVNAMGSVPINFSFNPSTHVVTFSVTLGANANVFKVTGTNQAGTDSKMTVIKYTGDGNTNNTNQGGSGHHGGSINNNNSNDNNNQTPNNGGGKQNGNNNPKNDNTQQNSNGKGGNTQPQNTNNGGNTKTTTTTPTTPSNGKGGDGKTTTPPQNGKGGDGKTVTTPTGKGG